MEGSGPRIEFQPRYSCGRSILRGGNDSSSICYSVHEMLTGGQIEPSDSPWSSPVVLVTKRDEGTGFVLTTAASTMLLLNYKAAYPLPRIDDTLDMLAGKQWFSTLDLASGYWQVSLSQEARVKTAFATHSGLFQFRPL